MTQPAHKSDIDTAGQFTEINRDGTRSVNFVAQGMHCAGCMQRIEQGIGALDGVAQVRANLSTKRVKVTWDPGRQTTNSLIDAFSHIGFDAAPFNPELAQAVDEQQGKTLLRAMGVAGFAAANVMLLSVSVWSGLFSDMEAETRQLFHWISALIALPAIAYAGRPFFHSAMMALKARALNMDVPISLAVLAAAAMSLVETIRGAEHVYFDASIALLFFLLIGRYLDLWARARACSAAQNLLGLRATAATLINEDGTRTTCPLADIPVGARVAVPAGMRIPTDGIVEEGQSSIDKSLLTGESLPSFAGEGAEVFAGTLNLSAPLAVRVTRLEKDSTLAEIVALMEAAEQHRTGYRRLADRAAKIYAPTVHLLALVTLMGWLAAGGGWHMALTSAIAVLIVTCPCALGLAVPVVQVVASGKLLKHGIIVKSGDALERLATINHIVFDKTGTLTEGRPDILDSGKIPAATRALACALARESHHPLAQALTPLGDGVPLPNLDGVREQAGQGVEARFGTEQVRLGSRTWVHLEGENPTLNSIPDPAIPDPAIPDPAIPDPEGPELWLRRGKEPATQFRFVDRLRKDARATIAHLQFDGLSAELLSGDRPRAVEWAAASAGLTHWQARQSPADKVAHLDQLKKDGARALMVGDGLNDAPALRAAHVSMSPATAADISQTAADLVFQGADLKPVEFAIGVARKSRTLILENFGLSVAYNLIAVPLAMSGLVTPLIAAIAMSASSLTVTLNALRLNRARLSEGGSP